MKARRPYRMTERAAAAERTGEAILDAAVATFWEAPTDQLSLNEVASRAGVSAQTVIRRFGGREGVVAAAAERESRRIGERRDQARPGDLSGAVRVLVDHYEDMGDQLVRLTAEADRTPGLAPIVEQGRRAHRDWCARVFAPAIHARAEHGPAAHARLLAQVESVCDVQTWHHLRRVSGLDRQQTEQALAELLHPLLE